VSRGLVKLPVSPPRSAECGVPTCDALQPAGDRARWDKRLGHGHDSAFVLTRGQDLTDSFDIVKQGAKVVSVASIDPATARDDLGMGRLLTALVWVANTKIRRRSRRRGVSYRPLMMHPSGGDLDVLARLVDGDQLKPVTDRVFPFEQIPDAFAYLEEGQAKGKVIVRL
jgi:NADPH:quinone reductase-like Zn-dependent oxidoreductase